MFFQIILNFLPVYSKKRTDHTPIDWPDPGKPPDSGSSCQIQKHCLCIIVLMMRKRDLGPPITDPYLLKRRSSHQTPCLLHRQLFLRSDFFYILMIHNTGNIPLPAKCFRKPFISFCCFSAKSVIHMHCDHIKSDFFLQSQKYKKQAYRIRAARYPCDYFIFFLQHMIFFNKI